MMFFNSGVMCNTLSCTGSAKFLPAAADQWASDGEVLVGCNQHIKT